MIALIGLTMTDSNAEYVCGDANVEGLLNVSDAVFRINYVFAGGPTPDSKLLQIVKSGEDWQGNAFNFLTKWEFRFSTFHELIDRLEQEVIKGRDTDS